MGQNVAAEFASSLSIATTPASATASSAVSDLVKWRGENSAPAQVQQERLSKLGGAMLISPEDAERQRQQWRRTKPVARSSVASVGSRLRLTVQRQQCSVD